MTNADIAATINRQIEQIRCVLIVGSSSET
jgi:hypothetical protein